ncbi:MAG: ATP-binding cassette domain-containing protein [Anaerolineae bacterium]|nr:ATP-binding cassette domain-containing protein [Anaerolineae bacterium]
MSIIEVHNLSKNFNALAKQAGFKGSLRSLLKPQRISVEAVKHISFTVDRGERLAFIGPNGAGKSTTIKMLVGILYPTGGSARVLDLVPWEARERLSYQIGAVFGQKSQMWYHLPPVDSFDLLCHIYDLDRPTYRQRLDYLVGLFEIEPYLRTPVRKLSLGERMRCEIAAALLHRPKILFLDEPTIGLDVVVKQRIRDLILRLNNDEGVTIFLTSHDAGDVEVLCRRAMVINHGEVIYDALVNDLKHNFLRTKTISLKLGTTWQPVEMPGVVVVKHKGYGVKLQVDIDQVPIDSVMTQLMGRNQIVDITIDEPPMEEIITQIYSTTPEQHPGVTEL